MLDWREAEQKGGATVDLLTPTSYLWVTVDPWSGLSLLE